LQKGKKKLEVKSIYGKNCMIFLRISLRGSSPVTAPAIEGGKKAMPMYSDHKHNVLCCTPVVIFTTLVLKQEVL
jgi:hypothetical protein